MFSDGPSTVVGTVNGKEISYADFEAKLQNEETRYKQQGYPMNETSRLQLQQQLWNQEVNRLVMQAEFEKLGLTVGKKELNDALFNNPPEDAVQAFTDPQTGMFNEAAYQQQIMTLKNSNVPQDQQNFASFLAGIEYGRLNDKFNSLVAAATYLPKWYLEKQNAERSLMANISYVMVPYATVPDSSVTVSDKDIQNYINKNKDQFKVEESRNIEYVTFNAAPTAEDSAEVRDQLVKLRSGFETATDVEGFINKNYSELGYFKGKVPKTSIQGGIYTDSITQIAPGQVYGPYVFGTNYIMTKMVSKAVWPDTVNVRHILIGLNANNGQTVRDDSTAKKLADSIERVIRAGSNFDSLMTQYSDDGGSKANGGKYENVTPGQMVPEFNEFIFSKPTGSKGVVKTQFGYHYIEVLSQKGSSPVFEVAYLAKPIVASRTTDATASNAANQFAGNSRNPKDFAANWEKDLKAQGIQKIPVTLGQNDYNIVGLGVSRSFVKAVYEADQGDVIEPTMIGDKYVVAVVTAVNKAGTMPLEQARLQVEPLLRNEKKAENIIKKIGPYTSLEDASTKAGFPIENLDSIRFEGQTQLSYETKLLGAAFNTANNGKVVAKPIDGASGVYVLRVNSQATTPVAAANIEDQRRMARMQAIQRISGGNYGNFGFGMQDATPVSVLRKLADIDDNRKKFNY